MGKAIAKDSYVAEVLVVVAYGVEPGEAVEEGWHTLDREREATEREAHSAVYFADAHSERRIGNGTGYEAAGALGGKDEKYTVDHHQHPAALERETHWAEHYQVGQQA